MTNNNNILLAALGGAIIAALIAGLVGKNKGGNFPLSNSTGLDQLSDMDSAVTNDEFESVPEMNDVLQHS